MVELLWNNYRLKSDCLYLFVPYTRTFTCFYDFITVCESGEKLEEFTSYDDFKTRGTILYGHRPPPPLTADMVSGSFWENHKPLRKYRPNFTKIKFLFSRGNSEETSINTNEPPKIEPYQWQQ